MSPSGSTGEFKVPARTYLLWIAIIGLIPLLVIFRQNASNQGRPLGQHEFMQKATNDLIARATITLAAFPYLMPCRPNEPQPSPHLICSLPPPLPFAVSASFAASRCVRVPSSRT